MKAKKKVEYYLCGCCECYHPAKWDGDCRENANRYAMDELDTKHGPLGWVEVPQPLGFTQCLPVKFPDKSPKVI
jgi:hypothetical protein